VNPVSRWRIAASIAVLLAFLYFIASFAPVYYRNYQLQSYVATLPQRVESQTRAGSAPSDDVVREWVLEKARELRLPVVAADVQIQRAPAGGPVQSIGVQYKVRMDLPGYTVNLHFYPGAGSR
jgi:hypothetical protein